MEKDLKLIEKILNDLNYSVEYSNVLLNSLKSYFEESGLDQITPNMIYNNFAYDLGKKDARDIANYFEELKQTGSYRTELEKLMDKWKS